MLVTVAGIIVVMLMLVGELAETARSYSLYSGSDGRRDA
jgi:hypothetical protein